MNAARLSFLPHDPNRSFSCDSEKMSHIFTTITLVAVCAIVGTLVATGTLVTPGAPTYIAVYFAFGALFSFLSIAKTQAFKERYDEMCPGGNLSDFCKRPWTEFSGSNYLAWKTGNLLIQQGFSQSVEEEVGLP